MSEKLFEERVKFVLYLDRDEREQLARHARTKCMSMSQWIRQVVLHVATKQGVFVPREAQSAKHKAKS